MGSTASEAAQNFTTPRLAVAMAAAKDVSQIATLPEVTLKIIEIVDDPKSTAKDLQRVISTDPALCARVLKVVNSSFYGLPAQVGNIDRAIVLLGLNAVKNIAISSSLTRLFRGGRISRTFNAKDVWDHCIAVATASNLIARRARLDVPDQAFHAGLVHDIGLMVEMQAQRAKLIEAIEQAEQKQITLQEAELEILGADHQDFGAALCQMWRFPPGFAYVAGFHHRPHLVKEEDRPLVAAVTLADQLAARLQLGYTGTIRTLDPDPALLDLLKLTPKMLDDTIEALPEAFRTAENLLA